MDKSSELFKKVNSIYYIILDKNKFEELSPENNQELNVHDLASSECKFVDLYQYVDSAITSIKVNYIKTSISNLVLIQVREDEKKYFFIKKLNLKILRLLK